MDHLGKKRITGKKTYVIRALIALSAIGMALGLPYLAFNRENRSLDATARARATGGFAALRDGLTHYDLTGPLEGPPLVLVHGFSVPAFLWDGTFEALGERGFRVLRYDLYGRGYSDRPNLAYDDKLFTRQLAGLLDELGMRGPVGLVGISMGAGVVESFALAYPERAGRIALMDPAPSSPPTLAARILSLPLVGDYLIAAFGSLILPAGQKTDFLDPLKIPAGYLERYREQMRYRGFSRAIVSSVRHIYDPGYMERYARIEGLGRPVLLIWGREDRTAPFADSETVRSLMPRAEFRAIEGAGHLPHIERSEIVNGLLAEFFGR